jgi:hypothetical protein
MTGKELIREIADLGGKSQFNTESEARAIYTAINRAIDEIGKLFPVVKTVRLQNYPIRPTAFYKGITVHKGGEDIVYNASGIKSLAFAVSGTGRATLSCAGRTHTFEWQDVTSDLQLCRGILEELVGIAKGDVVLTFSGEYSYMISDLSFYSELVSPIAEDVTTYSKWQRYDLASEKYVGGRFLDFASLPVRHDNVDLNSPRDFKIEGTSVFIRSDLEGIYEISYRVRPSRIDADNDSLEIDIDRELHNLIAPRAAFYLYYMVDEEVADRCNIEYQRLYAQYMRIHKVKTPQKFRDVRGW